MDKKSIYFVIAAYNEENSIVKVVGSLKKAGYEHIIVVDDGSSDNTYEAAKRAGAIALQHIVNRGQGASLQTGMDYALMHDAQYIVHFDADGQHRIEDLPAMLQPVISGRYDVALGSRFLKDYDLPFVRKVLLKGAVVVQNTFYGVNLSDAHNGFRVFSRKAAERIQITMDRMAHASEIVEEIKDENLRFKEVPVKILYNDDTIKKGHGGFMQAIKVLSNMFLKKFLK
jgi:polyprenyl-phospho-N-acetylgalactosaminyl synthase